MAQENVKLTAKQQRFCLEYIKDHNGTQAAIRAGYSAASAAAQASRLLSHAKVKAWLAEQTKALAEQAGITADAVIREMAAVGMVRLSDVMWWDDDGNIKLVPSDDLTPEQAAAVSEVSKTEVVNMKTGDVTTTTRLKMHPKVSALAKLAEYLGIGPDQLPPSVQVHINAQDGSKVAVQLNEVVRDYGEALDQAMGIVKEIPPKQLEGKTNGNQEIPDSPVTVCPDDDTLGDSDGVDTDPGQGP